MTPEAIEAVARAIIQKIDDNWDKGTPDQDVGQILAETAITAYQQAVAKDAVGKQCRYKLEDGSWTRWFTDAPTVRLDLPIEYRDVFASPPAPHHDEWFSKITSFFVTHGMLDDREEYDLDDIMTALVDNYAPAPPAPAIPQGFKLVPIEPTEEMLDAYWHRAGESKEMRPRTHHSAKSYYNAMINAAPAQETSR